MYRVLCNRPISTGISHTHVYTFNTSSDNFYYIYIIYLEIPVLGANFFFSVENVTLNTNHRLRNTLRFLVIKRRNWSLNKVFDYRSAAVIPYNIQVIYIQYTYVHRIIDIIEIEGILNNTRGIL